MRLMRSVGLLGALALLSFLAIATGAFASEAQLPAGTKAILGTQTEIKGQNVTVKSNLYGALSCESVNGIASTLNQNGPGPAGSGEGTIELSGTAESGIGSGCGIGTKSRRVENFEFTKIVASDPPGKNGSQTSGTASVKFVEHVGSDGYSCNWSGENLPFTYIRGTNEIRFSEARSLKATPSACGSGTFSGSFQLAKRGTSTPMILR